MSAFSGVSATRTDASAKARMEINVLPTTDMGASIGARSNQRSGRAVIREGA